jgi:hypothetical protein
MGLLIAGAAAFWVVTALPARHLGGGDLALIHAGAAVLLCLLPALATLAWSIQTLKRDPQSLVVVALGGTGLRLAAVTLAGFVLYRQVPPFRGQEAFWAWLLASYFFVLALELKLLLRAVPKTDAPP